MSSLLASILTPGLVAAGVTVVVNWWLQRPRADLQMIIGGATAKDQDQIFRANSGSSDWSGKHWLPLGWVWLTNYGDGTAHNIKLSGERCRPRVWVDDLGEVTEEGELKATKPTWSDRIAALEPGATARICLMMSADQSVAKPIIAASWPRLPGRRWDWRKTIKLDLASPRIIEYGLPGQKDSQSSSFGR